MYTIKMTKEEMALLKEALDMLNGMNRVMGLSESLADGEEERMTEIERRNALNGLEDKVNESKPTPNFNKEQIDLADALAYCLYEKLDDVAFSYLEKTTLSEEEIDEVKDVMINFPHINGI